MKAQALLLAIGMAGGLGIGWFSAPSPSPTASPPTETPVLTHASAEIRQAHERLSELGLAPALEAEARPPPPDITVLFRRDLTAIEGQGPRAVVWIVDTAQTHQRRALRVGDAYREGWRVARIEAQSVELRRRREVRTIAVFALPVIDP